MLAGASLQVRVLVERVIVLRRYTMVVLTLALVFLVGVVLLRSYFGDSPSPYGTCYAQTGRAVPCKALARGR